ncbi:MAG: terminase family protein, partial [Oceanospirillum sp.]|nr:terminase family protein [Oceanospirillum sp.]
KTYTGTDIDAIHLLGDYPDDWPGHAFDFAPHCWGLGFSMEKTRDLLQKALFGDFFEGKFSGGLVPKSRILSWESATGTPNAMRTVRVKHKSGGTSVIQFWSYSQGQHAIMGDVVDWFHVDEEPKDQKIRPQVLTRTVNGDKGKGGRGIYTFTPENGRTELVIQFMDDPSPDQYFMQKGWDDAPHITPEKRERMLKQYPPHQRDMRTKGVPMLGHGRIYDFSEDFITCEPFEIPNHFRVIDGMDFGWDHPQARVRLVFNPETGEHWVTHAWKQSNCTPDQAWGATKIWAENFPTAWPHDGLNSEKSSGEQQKSAYIKAGFRMLPKQATWPDGSNGVEAGIFELRDLLSKGLLKIFNGARPVLDEMLQYHRDDRGKIVKSQDDALDALRYAYMMKRAAISYGDIISGNKVTAFRPKPIKAMGRR